ncbi:MAG TPA: alpha/beta hydrolase [Thermoleophilaceae bacterium]
MTASTLLLVLGILALLGVVNALRPLRNIALALPSWVAAWVTVELAPFLVVFDLVAAAVLVALGGLEHPRGLVGLGGVLVAVGVAMPRIVAARRSAEDLEEAVAELDPGEPAAPYPRHEIALPFLARRRAGVRCVRGIKYTRSQKLDVYMPDAPAEEPRPAIVQIHGGAWVIGSRHEQGVPLLSHLAANGWVGFNIDYRLSPWATWPAQIVDVKRAIAWVREHAEEWDVDPSFVAITGGSAGGHLSALAALTAGDPDFQPGFEDADTSVAAAVPFYGVYDLLDDEGIHLKAVHQVLERLVFKTRRRDEPERFRAASPVHRVHAAAPPTFVIAGEKDTLIGIDEARRFVERLRATSQAPVLYAELKGAQHAFDLVASWRSVPVIESVERFLTTVRGRHADPSPRQLAALGE